MMETLDFYDPADEYKKHIFDLNTMLEIGKTLNASLSLKDVLDIIILTCNGHFHASDAVILLSMEKGNSNIFTYESENENISIDSSSPLVKYIQENQRVIQIKELEELTELKPIHHLFKKKEIKLIVPLRFKGKINGILCLKNKEEEFGTEYSEDEKKYVDIIAGFASVAIENARLYEMATLDRKTKLYNHGFFQNRLIEEIERAERYKSDLALIITDIDLFKRINDTYGHLVGDEVLVKVADTLKSHVRTFDIPARFGGEEFTVILPETDANSSFLVAERLRKGIEKLSFKTPRGSFSVTASFGVATLFHGMNMTEDILIEHADKALYYAKEHGRNQGCFYESIAERMKV